MRGTGNHTPPEDMQPAPDDNVTERVMYQVRVFTNGVPDGRYGVNGQPLYRSPLIHTESAREIAAWWQAPDNAFSAFSHTGTITEELASEILGQIQDMDWHPDTYSFESADESDDAHREEISAQQSALRALLAYVRACPVTVWVVGKNIAGYLPESDTHAFMDYADALSAYRGMLTDEAPEDVARTDECACVTATAQKPPALPLNDPVAPCCGRDVADCDCPTADETCELCTVEALVAGYIRDELDSGPAGRGERTEESLTIPADSWAGSMAYWIHKRTETYGEYLAAQ